MNRTTFLFTNIIVTILEYIGLFYLLSWSFQSNQIAASIVGFLLMISVLIVLAVKRSGIQTVEQTEETSLELSQYEALVKQANQFTKKKISIGVIDNKNVMASAMEYNDQIYINLAFSLPDHVKIGVVAHEIGHVISGSSNKILFAQVRFSTLISSILKYAGNTLGYHKNVASKGLRYVVYGMYRLVNMVNVFVLFPYMKQEERIANSYAIQLGAGDSLRCYYARFMRQSGSKLDPFDLSHPSVTEMIEAMNKEMKYTHDYEIDIYAVDDHIYYIDHAEEQANKDKKVFQYYYHVADKHKDFVCYRLGLYYKDGKGTNVDFDASIKWFHRALQLGYQKASYQLGLIYEKQELYEQAIHFYSLAMEYGMIQSYSKLGFLLEQDETTMFDAYLVYYNGAIKKDLNCKKKLQCRRKV